MSLSAPCGVRASRHCRPQLAAGTRSVQARASCKLSGTGSSTPATIFTNDDLSEFIETNDEWIRTRTGIQSRHVLGEGERITDHSISSAKSALEMAGIAGEDVDMVILCTSTPDDLFGSATQVQLAIGATGAVAFDLTAACSGFVLGLVTASQFIKSGACKNVVVVGADALSRHIDWTDRGTCILFGDGAGAAVLTAHEGPCALLGMDMNSDGAGLCNLNAPMDSTASGKATRKDQRDQKMAFDNIQMNGSEVFKFAVRAVPATLNKSLAAGGLQTSDIDWLVMHQANQRILDSAAKKLGLPADKVVSNLAQYGNTSAASIPLALDEAVRNGSIKDGDVLAMAGFGAGLTWASAIMRWR